jgi:1,4-alpha-glucan branching enzyme
MTAPPPAGEFDRNERDLAAQLAAGRCGDPFSVLGPHSDGDGWIVRVFVPGARTVEMAGTFLRNIGSGLFIGRATTSDPQLLRIDWYSAIQEIEDPYAFGPVLGEMDLHLFVEGMHQDLAGRFGANVVDFKGVKGVHFAVWAPNASRVSVVGDFNGWNGLRHPMRLRHEAGVWEIFIPRLTDGERYKFEIVAADGRLLPQKADPLAKQTELPPATASIVAPPAALHWSDAVWMSERADRHALTAPISIYEVHAGSWVRPHSRGSEVLNWNDLSERLIPYAKGLGFTHIELMPIMEYPFGGSWGYQPLSQFAPTARFGRPEDFAHFVDECHRAELGIILDWVPAHFPTDPHGLAQFDGTALYEHADPREGFHRDWNTLIYNLGRREVSGFLIASALYWLEYFHVDGLRVDAVASMLYRDYSRQPGEWIPNQYGGRENLEAVAFLRRLTSVVASNVTGVMTIAEESTAWPGVTAPVDQGGLGFTYKWNMGWMHDTLNYLAIDPLYRKWHHNEMTFGLVYAFSERFVLPLSHDEVVHGKSSIYGRAPGDNWQKLANLRAYYTFMWTHPGKKLLFMGDEIGQPTEWNHDAEVAWDLLKDPGHAGLQRLVSDLNHLYRDLPALHATDTDGSKFRWIVGDDATNSVFAWLRDGDQPIVVVVNMTPLVRMDYRIGVPCAGRWSERLNSDAALYGGSNVGNAGQVATEMIRSHGFDQSVSLTLPPLGALILAPKR